MTLSDLNERIDYGKKISELIDSAMIPVSPKMMNDLGYSDEERTLYHFTNVVELKHLKNISKKSQLSCFSKPGLSLTKLPSNPNILLKIKGRPLIEADGDLYTHLDYDGRRWIQIEAKDSPSGKKLKFQIDGIISNLKKEYKKYSTSFYRAYITALIGLLDNGGYKLLNNHLKHITTDYNEIVADHIKIIGIYEFNSSGKKDDIIDFDFKYLGDLSANELMKL